MWGTFNFLILGVGAGLLSRLTCALTASNSGSNDPRYLRIVLLKYKKTYIKFHFLSYVLDTLLQHT